jgi:hypothetical protein
VTIDQQIAAAEAKFDAHFSIPFAAFDLVTLKDIYESQGIGHSRYYLSQFPSRPLIS